MGKIKHVRYLAAIGVAYSISGDLNNSLLPEKALCIASPIFYSDAKACSLVFTLLKNNYDLFNDSMLREQISYMTNKLAIAMLGGILHKANKAHFSLSIKKCLKLAKGADKSLIKKSMHILADHNRLPFDETLNNLFGIKVNEITEVDRKKTFPRTTIIKTNLHFAARDVKLTANVFYIGRKSDYNLFEPKTAVQYVKANLCERLISIAKKHRLLQKDVAKLTGSSPAQINEIMNLRLKRFTIDFLIEKTELLVANLKKQSIEERVEVRVTI